MKKLLALTFILSMALLAFNPAYADHDPLPNEDGYCGVCDVGAPIGARCECILDKEKWDELGHDTARCVKNPEDPFSGMWLCQVHGFGQ